MSDFNDPGFFGNGFDSNGDGHLSDSERINDLAQFMDSYGNDIVNGDEDWDADADTEDEGYPYNASGAAGFVPPVQPPSPEVQAARKAQKERDSRVNRRILLVILLILGGFALLHFTNIIDIKQGVFQRQQSHYHGIMKECEAAGLTLSIPEDWAEKETPASDWDRETLYEHKFTGFSKDGKYFAMATVEVRRQKNLKQEGEVLPELALYQKYGLYHEYREIEIPGFPLAYRQNFSFAPVVDGDPGTIGTSQVVFTQNQAVVVTVMGHKGFLAGSDINAILDAVDYSNFKELDD